MTPTTSIHLERHRRWLIGLAVLFVISTFVAVLALRANNRHMLMLRDKVYAADKANGDVEGALRELRGYIYGHMNTSMAVKNGIYPPLQLKYRYERLSDAEKQRVADMNQQVYTNAQLYCEEQNPTAFSGRSRVPCIEQYVSQHGINPNPVPDDLYKFDFVSPRWSPDLAGWSLVVAAFSGLILLLVALDIVGHALHERFGRPHDQVESHNETPVE